MLIVAALLAGAIVWAVLRARRITVHTPDGGRMIFPDAKTAADYLERVKAHQAPDAEIWVTPAAGTTAPNLPQDRPRLRSVR